MVDQPWRMSTEELMAADPEFKKKLIELALVHQGPPGYINNPIRQPLVEGGIAARGLFGLPPTDQQRLEDAFYQFPTNALYRYK